MDAVSAQLLKLEPPKAASPLSDAAKPPRPTGWPPLKGLFHRIPHGGNVGAHARYLRFHLLARLSRLITP